MVRTFPNYKTNTRVRPVPQGIVLPRWMDGFPTFATLPCSRQSCSSSLSIPEAHSGLERGRGTSVGLAYDTNPTSNVPFVQRVLPVHARQVSPEVARTVSG